jgi:type IV secretory pathway TraG/TraD family ATPase VirD4
MALDILALPAVQSDRSGLSPLQPAAGGPARPNEVRDVQNIADILVDPEGALERRNHWEKTSHSLLVGAILHILYAEEEKTLARVATFLSDPQRDFVTTLKRMMTTNHLGDAEHPKVHPVVASAARETLNKAPMSDRACCRPPCRSSASIATPRWPRSPHAATGASPI